MQIKSSNVGDYAEKQGIARTAMKALPKAETSQVKKVNKQTEEPAGRQAEKSEDEERGVTLEISEEMKDMWQEQLESAKESAKAAGEAFKDLAKLLEIARRISKGDKVPATDEKKLMEFSSDLYQAAKAAAMLHANEKHKKHKSLYEEEEEAENEKKLRSLKREQEAAGSSSGAGGSTAEVVATEETADGG